MKNFTYLEEMSERSCRHLEETMPHYHKVSMETMLMDSGLCFSVFFSMFLYTLCKRDIGVSINGGSPKWLVYDGKSISNG